MVPLARKALMGCTNAAGQAAAAAGGGGGRWRRRAARSHSSQQLFSCFLLLLRDQVKCERGRRAGWARSASRRVAVVGAHLRRPWSALPGPPSPPGDDRDALQLTSRAPPPRTQVRTARPPNPETRRRCQLPPRASRCAERVSGALLVTGARGGEHLDNTEISDFFT